MTKRRKGIGAIISFSTTREGYFLDFKRANGLKVSRILDPEVALALAEIYGVRSPSRQNVKSMKTLKGAVFRYQESSQGMLTHVEILPS